MEALISINNQLRQPDAAVGVLTKAQRDLHMELKESWCARCGGCSLPACPSRPAGCWLGGDACFLEACCTGMRLWGLDGELGRHPMLQGKVPPPPCHGRYEKLGRWEDALRAYERKLENATRGTPAYGEALIGQCRWAGGRLCAGQPACAARRAMF